MKKAPINKKGETKISVAATLCTRRTGRVLDSARLATAARRINKWRERKISRGTVSKLGTTATCRMYAPVRGKTISVSNPTSQCARPVHKTRLLTRSTKHIRKRSGGLGAGVHFRGPLPGVEDAVDYGNRGQHGDH